MCYMFNAARYVLMSTYFGKYCAIDMYNELLNKSMPFIQFTFPRAAMIPVIIGVPFLSYSPTQSSYPNMSKLV